MGVDLPLMNCRKAASVYLAKIDPTTGACGVFTGSDNCWCNYQTTCGCECYYCPIPDWLQDIDGPNGPYPVPDWNAVGPCAGATC